MGSRPEVSWLLVEREHRIIWVAPENMFPLLKSHLHPHCEFNVPSQGTGTLALSFTYYLPGVLCFVPTRMTVVQTSYLHCFYPSL